MTPRDALISGLRQQGWQPYTTSYRQSARWESYRHPNKGERTLWVTPKGRLYVGLTIHASDPVNPTFIQSTIRLGRQELR